MSEGVHGEVAERPNAGALKAPEGKLSGGSNPSLAAFSLYRTQRGIWEVAGVDLKRSSSATPKPLLPNLIRDRLRAGLPLVFYKPVQ